MTTPSMPSANRSVLRPHAEHEFAHELAALAASDDRERPPSWRLSPWAVRTYLLGGTLDDGTVEQGFRVFIAGGLLLKGAKKVPKGTLFFIGQNGQLYMRSGPYLEGDGSFEISTDQDNWKTLVDNCSDNYHVPTSHLSSAMVQSRFLGRPQLSHKDQFESPNKHVFVNGAQVLKDGEHTGAKWFSKTHIDCVGRDFDVWFDGKQVMRAGRFLV